MKKMTLIINHGYRVHCPICDWIHFYNHKKDVPEICPACGGNGEAWTNTWVSRKEEIHTKLRNKYEHLSSGKS